MGGPRFGALQRACLPAKRRLLGGSACAAIVVLAGCGTPNARVLDATEKARKAPDNDNDQELSESDKIRALLEAVRSSDATFTQAGQERDGAAAAADLERRVARVPAGVPTARQFIDRVGAGHMRAKEQDTVHMTEGTVVPARDWLLARLAEIEGTPAHAGPVAEQANTPHDEGAPAELGILDALTIVERSNLRFVAPPRRNAKGELKGKRKEYTSTEFSEMLRKKWDFLGADIHDLHGFVEEIATDAFTTMEPYRVEHPDGTDEEFRTWLLAELEARRRGQTKRGQP